LDDSRCGSPAREAASPTVVSGWGRTSSITISMCAAQRCPPAFPVGHNGNLAHPKGFAELLRAVL
jgi:hypothetical protein